MQVLEVVEMVWCEAALGDERQGKSGVGGFRLIASNLERGRRASRTRA